jgi:hypothetical protein
MLASGPLRDRQQPFPLVIPDRVRSHPGPGSQLPDGQRPVTSSALITRTLNLGPCFKFKPKFRPNRVTATWCPVRRAAAGLIGAGQ